MFLTPFKSFSNLRIIKLTIPVQNNDNAAQTLPSQATFAYSNTAEQANKCIVTPFKQSCHSRCIELTISAQNHENATQMLPSQAMFAYSNIMSTPLAGNAHQIERCIIGKQMFFSTV